MFFGDWLQRREMLSPNKVALIDAIPSTEFILSKVEGLKTGNDNQPITYREWNQQTNQLTNFLWDGLGIRKGDRVSIYAMNRVEYLDALFACNKLGAILHVINWRLTTHELVSFSTGLLVANETAAPKGLNAALIDVVAHMTFRAIIHFHSIPRIEFDPRDIFPPDIPAVTGNPIGLIGL